MYLLDTDSASLALNGDSVVQSRINNARAPVRLSSIAAEEFLKGTLGLINRQRDRAGQSAAHALLEHMLQEICRYEILPYDDEAARVFASFPSGVKHVGPQDCRIAASAISRRLIVVTANRKDFSRIPGVQFEDWSR